MQPSIARVRPQAALSDAFVITEGRYTVRLARNHHEIDDALRLRFEVFNLEMGEGLESSFISGRDEDEHDERCDHLIAIDNETETVIGTYRLQTLEAAGSVDRFYCSGEFDLACLPSDLLRRSMEIGRACIAKEHRNRKVLYLLWKGLVRALELRGKSNLFGCCSLTTLDLSDGMRALVTLERIGVLHPEFWARPRPRNACTVNDTIAMPEPYDLPKLFRAYLRFGAKICSPPAIDREFGTIDFLVMFDLVQANASVRKMFLDQRISL